MARFNEILEGRFNRALQKICGMKGPASVPQLGTEIIPTFPLFWGAENRYLEGWALHSAEVVMTAVAASISAVMLRNPVGSNVIAVIHKVTCTTSSAGSDSFILSLGPRTTDLPVIVALGAPSCFDTRFGSTTRSGMIFSDQSAAGPGTAPPDRLYITVPASSSSEMISTDIHEIPLLPGSAISIRDQVVNQSAAYTIWWRERVMTDSELT